MLKGSLSDYREVPGIANLVAWLLLIGSKPYPQVHEFHRFVVSRDGNIELDCNPGDTRFYVDVKSSSLAVTLKRLVQRCRLYICSFIHLIISTFVFNFQICRFFYRTTVDFPLVPGIHRKYSNDPSVWSRESFKTGYGTDFRSRKINK